MSLSVSLKKDLKDFSLDVDFSSEENRIGILGASGSGKSMTLKMIAGVMMPDSGRISLNGNILCDIGKSTEKRRPAKSGKKNSAGRIWMPPQKRKIGYLFQNYALFPTMTVAENIACGLANRKDLHTKEEKDEVIADIVRRLRLDGLEKRLPSELSGGQQQRVALARILVYEPDAILLDEPFSALDTYLKDHLQAQLSEMLEDYKGIAVMVSHSRDEIYRFCTDTIVLDQGRVADCGNTKEIFHTPRSAVSARLTGCKNISSATRVDAHTLTADDWGVTLHLSREIPEDVHHVGFRAHEFIPVYGERVENCIRVELESQAEMPFETYYYLKPERVPDGESSGEGHSGHFLSWRVQRDLWDTLKEKGLPSYLQMPEEHILLLQ